MKNIQELRSELTGIYGDLKTGTIDRQAAESMINACGKIISSVKCELTYAAAREEMPQIAFLETGEDRAPKRKRPAAVKPEQPAAPA